MPRLRNESAELPIESHTAHSVLITPKPPYSNPNHLRHHERVSGAS
jgi:hypothetical protein